MAAREDLRRNATSVRILRILARGDELTASQLAERLRRRASGIAVICRRLEARGLVVSEREGRARRWRIAETEEDSSQ